jgi:hypothetical protein
MKITKRLDKKITKWDKYVVIPFTSFLIVLSITLAVVGAAHSCKEQPTPIPVEAPAPIHDTVWVDHTVYIEDTIGIDSLIRENNYLREQLFVAEYKLERIRYYNDIAAKGNNITFLRGWINRVLKDEE